MTCLENLWNQALSSEDLAPRLDSDWVSVDPSPEGAVGVPDALGQETKYQPPVCVVPEIFALNGSTQQASGGVQQFSKSW